MILPHTHARRLVGFAAAALLAIVGVGIATPASAATATLTVHGTVVDSSSAPVADQAVQIYTNASSYSAVTDASGQFTVLVEYDTNMAYISVSAGPANAYIDPATLGGATETTVVLTLPDVVTVTIEGYVADAYGASLPGTPVWAYSPAGGANANAGLDGFYTLTVDALAGGYINMSAGDHHSSATVSGYSDGDTIRQDFTVGTGTVHTVEIDGVYLDVAGSPIPFGDVYVSSDQESFPITTGADGTFTVSISYGEFGQVNLSAAYAFLDLDPASLIGQTNVSVVLQDLPIANFTIEGMVYDLDGNTVANQLLVAYGESTVYTRSDATGHYSLSAAGNPTSEVALSVEDGNNPYDITGYTEGSVITQDVVVTGSGEELGIAGPSIECDIDGDGFADQVVSSHMITSDRVDWQFFLGESGWDWASASFGQGDTSAVYCADLNGDGASELIAQGSHDKFRNSTGATVTKNDWWIYDYTTDSATARTFPNGEISGVVFENLDADASVEMIVERLRESGPNTFWILDDATADVEKIRVGFGTGGTLEFADFDGVAGIDIVTTKVRANGTTVTEYYTRASGQGEIVTVKVKANGTAQ